MRPDNGAVDHLDALLDALRLIESFQEKFPQPGKRPAPKLPVDRRPFAEMLVQVTPLGTGAREPENPVQNKPVILRASSAMRAPNRDKGLKTSPFLIRHQSSNQSRLLAKATLNQKLDRWGILFVNKA